MTITPVAAAPRAARAGRREALALLTLWTAGVTWPLLAALAADVPALLARRASPVDLLALAVVPALVLPLALEALLALLVVGDRALGRALRAATLWLLATAALLHVSSRALPRDEGVSGDVLAVLCAVLGAGATAALFRFPGLRSGLARLSPVALLVPLLFLARGEVRELLASGSAAAGLAPVVLVIADELPLESLLDESGGVDSALAPQLHGLARRGLLCRNATTVHEDPQAALAALLTGQRRGASGDPAPTLFTLLGTTHQPVVWGPQARALAPSGLLLGHRAPPGRLSADAVAAWARAILPPPFDRLARQSPGAWQAPDPGQLPPASTVRPPVPAPGLPRPEAFRDWLAHIDSNVGPPLAVIHTGLPSRPWNHLPDGRRYAVTPEVAGLVDGQWSDAPWPAAQGLQRHLLQVALLDRLLGELVAALDERGLAERAVIVVTATGGASFAPGQHLVTPTVAAAPQVLSVPLVIIAPADARVVAGSGSDRNLELIDVLPTLADLLGRPADPAWDGESLFSDAPPPAFKTADRRAGPPTVLAGDAPRSRPAVARRVELLGRDADAAAVLALSPAPELVGARLAELGLAGLHPATAQVHSVTGAEDELPCLLRGAVLASHARDLPDLVAVALNGTIVAATGTLDRPGLQVGFEALLPPEAFASEGAKKLALFAPGRDGRLLALDVVTWVLARDERGDEQILGSNGRVLSVRPGAIGAFLDQAERLPGGVRLLGWAGDRLLSRPADMLLVFVGERFVLADGTGVERAELPVVLGDPALRHAGFDFEVPLELLGPAHASATRVFAVVDDVACELLSQHAARWLTEVTWRVEGELLLGSDGATARLGEPSLWGTVERVEIRGDRLLLQGWAADVAAQGEPAAVDEILVLADGASVASIAPGTSARSVADLLGGVEVHRAGFQGELLLSWIAGDPKGRLLVVARRGERASLLRGAPASAWALLEEVKDPGDEGDDATGHAPAATSDGTTDAPGSLDDGDG